MKFHYSFRMKVILTTIITLLLTSITFSANAAIYIYDELNRLTSIEDDNSVPLFNYTYDDNGNLLRVSPVDVTTPIWPAGSSLTAINVPQTGLTLSWTAAADDVAVTSYKVYKDSTLLGSTDGTSYNVTGLSTPKYYNFKVEAEDAAGNLSTTGPNVKALFYIDKPINFNGYEYVDSTHIKLYFDGESFNGHDTATPIVEGIDRDHFAIWTKNSPYTAVPISYILVSSGSNKSGVSGTYLNEGTTVTLGLGTPLSADTLYKLEMDTDTLMSYYKMSLGNYRTGMFFDFTFKTPDGSGNYTGIPDVTFWQANSATGVPWESNIVFVVDRPLKEDTISNLLSALSANFKKNGNTVTQDDTIDDTAVEGAESHTPVANIPRTAFIFPLVASAEAITSCYNLSSGSYSLEVPVITDVDNNSTSASETTSFTTVDSDIAGWLKDAPTYSNLTYNSVRINWSAGTIEPVADTFDLYKSENMFDNYAKVNVSDITGTSPYYYDVSNLTPETTYYFRVVPKNSYGAAGFSPAVRVFTPEEE